MSRVFANGLGDWDSIPGRVMPKTQKKKWYLMLPCLTLSIIRVRIKSKVEQSKEWNNALPLLLDVVAIEKGAFGSPLAKIANFTYLYVSGLCVSSF